MLAAILNFMLLAPPATEVPTRGYQGEEAVVGPDSPAAEPAEPEPEPEPMPRPPAPRVPLTTPEETGLAPLSQPSQNGPTPRWWGPFPRPKVIGFVGPMLQLTRLNAAFGATVGFGGGAWIRQRFAVGAAVLWLLNPIDAGKTTLGATQRLNVNYGGLTLAVVVARTRALSFTVEGLIGGGGACMQNPNDGSCYARTTMFLGQPGVGFHIKLGPIIRLVLGFGYRLVQARAWTGPGNQQLGGPTGTVMLELGWF
ncbi:MAG: hypothetical protein H0T76_18245 [Nannocystis sp.]|nr:hypothetical protein [Nannocystis sp.]MBA3548427.1 hypothetical protein [Nannocystis sp.]